MKDKCHCEKHRKEYMKYSVYDESKRPDNQEDSEALAGKTSPMPQCQMSSYGHRWSHQYATLDDRLQDPESQQPSFHIRPIPAEPTSKVIFTNQKQSCLPQDSPTAHLDHQGPDQASPERRSPGAATHLPQAVHSLVSEAMDTTEEESHLHR